MLEHSGTCNRSLFGHMSDDKNRNTEPFCQPQQNTSRFAHLRHAARRRADRFIVHRLDGVNDDDLRLFLLDYLLNPIQALVCHSNFGIPRRQTTGTDFNRVNLLMAVLEKRLGMQIGGCDAYVNLAGGIRITEPAIDLGIVMAIMSSFKNSPVPEGVVAFGEVGLSGEVRAVSMAEQRVREAQKLGFTTCILPQVCLEKMPKISGIRLVGVRSVADAAREL